MINLKTILLEIEEEKNTNVAHVEDQTEWKWSDVEHLFDMGFEREGDRLFVLNNPPIKVYKMKNGPYILEEPAENHEKHFDKDTDAPVKPGGLTAFSIDGNIKKHEFPTFVKLINFFDSYEQHLEY